MKAVVVAFNQEKALVGAFSVITNLWMELFQALVDTRDTGDRVKVRVTGELLPPAGLQTSGRGCNCSSWEEVAGLE